MNGIRVAVYGSLKKGGRLNGAMKDALFLGTSTFEGDLYHLGSYPAAVPGKGSVVCEVWECSDALVKRLDSIEGHPWMYKRTEIWVPNFGQCQAYFYQRRLHSSDKKIEDGNYNVADWK